MIKIREDVVFHDPESRIREYCDIEIYRGYDDQHSVDDIISMSDIRAANKLYAMIDRYDKNESSRIFERAQRISTSLSELANLAPHSLDENSWKETQAQIRNALRQLLVIRGIGLAKATKILHLKRPEVFPVLDSYVMRFLLNKELGTDKQRDVSYARVALNRFRKTVTSQMNEFESLSSSLHDLPIPLTTARIYDILCWTTQKWDILKIHSAPYGRATKSLLNLK